MRTRVFARGSFGAAHTLPCSDRLHGHYWEIEVGTEGIIDDLSDDLERICRELDYRNLDEMLPGVRTSPPGMAVYIHERLALAYPNLVLVRVETKPGGKAEVEWTPR